MMKRAIARACVMTAVIALSACGGAHTTPPAPATQQSNTQLDQPMDLLGGVTGFALNVLLGDAPPNISGRHLQRLDLGIKEIDAIENGQVTVLASFPQPLVVNVLAHQDDNGQSIANANVPRSDYQQLRLVVDLASSTAKFRGGPAEPVDFLVNVASASTVGAGSTTLTTSDGPADVDLLVTQPFSIPANHHQAVRLDFNAFESLALDQSGQVLARATLFVAPIDDMGSVRGRVLDSSGNPVSNATVVAVASDGSIGNTDWTDGRGYFRVGTLRTGDYRLMIYNTYTTAAGRVVTATGQSGGSASATSVSGPMITINGGRTTSAGTITD